MKQEALEAFVNEVTSSLQSAKTFASAQLPDVAQQVIKYALALNIFDAVVGFGMLCLCYVAHLKIEKHVTSRDESVRVFYVLVFIIFLLGMAIFGCSVENILQVTFAPKVYLLEYVAKLVSCK